MGNQSNWFDFKREKRIVVAKKICDFCHEEQKRYFWTCIAIMID